VGTVVLRAYAISRNVGQPEITYSLIDTAGGQDFRIDPTSGEIQTNATLDYTRTDVYLVCRVVSLVALNASPSSVLLSVNICNL